MSFLSLPSSALILPSSLLQLCKRIHYLALSFIILSLSLSTPYSVPSPNLLVLRPPLFLSPFLLLPSFAHFTHPSHLFSISPFSLYYPFYLLSSPFFPPAKWSCSTEILYQSSGQFLTWYNSATFWKKFRSSSTDFHEA